MEDGNLLDFINKYSIIFLRSFSYRGGILMSIWNLETHVYAASFLNALFLAIQLVQVLRTRSAKSVPFITYTGFLYIQLVYVLFTFREELWHICIGMVASAAITATMLFLRLRWGKG